MTLRITLKVQKWTVLVSKLRKLSFCHQNQEEMSILLICTSNFRLLHILSYTSEISKETSSKYSSCSARKNLLYKDFVLKFFLEAFMFYYMCTMGAFWFFILREIKSVCPKTQAVDFPLRFNITCCDDVRVSAISI